MIGVVILVLMWVKEHRRWFGYEIEISSFLDTEALPLHRSLIRLFYLHIKSKDTGIFT